MMTVKFSPFSNEQNRNLSNAESVYDNWLETQRQFDELPYGMQWKKRENKDYLYRNTARSGVGTSIGPRGPETEAIKAKYDHDKATLSERLDDAMHSVKEKSAIWRALRMPRIDEHVLDIINGLDVAGLLGTRYLVIGTNAFVAYQTVCCHEFDRELGATEDFDLSWCGHATFAEYIVRPEESRTLFSVLKDIDSTFTKNTERTFQARNSKGIEVELLCAPSLSGKLDRSEFLTPVDLPLQELIIRGKPLESIVSDGKRLGKTVIPDPRWMSVHKLALALEPTRKPAKKNKDAKQGETLMRAVEAGLFPLHEFDEEFEKELAGSFPSVFDIYRKNRNIETAEAPAPHARRNTP